MSAHRRRKGRGFQQQIVRGARSLEEEEEDEEEEAELDSDGEQHEEEEPEAEEEDEDDVLYVPVQRRRALPGQARPVKPKATRSKRQSERKQGRTEAEGQAGTAKCSSSEGSSKAASDTAPRRKITRAPAAHDPQRTTTARAADQAAPPRDRGKTNKLMGSLLKDFKKKESDTFRPHRVSKSSEASLGGEHGGFDLSSLISRSEQAYQANQRKAMEEQSVHLKSLRRDGETTQSEKPSPAAAKRPQPEPVAQSTQKRSEKRAAQQPAKEGSKLDHRRLYAKAKQREDKLSEIAKLSGVEKQLRTAEVSKLETELRDAYIGVVLLHPRYALQKKVVYKLWQRVYAGLDPFLQQAKLAKQMQETGTYGHAQEHLQHRFELDQALEAHLGKAERVLRYLGEKLLRVQQKRRERRAGTGEASGGASGSDWDDAVEEVLGELYTCLGDLARYRLLYLPQQATEGPDAGAEMQAVEWYREALSRDYTKGKAHNQLAVLANGRKKALAALAHFVMALTVRHPFPARENLLGLYEENRKATAEMMQALDGRGVYPLPAQVWEVMVVRLVSMSDTHVDTERFNVSWVLAMHSLQQLLADQLLEADELMDALLALLYALDKELQRSAQQQQQHSQYTDEDADLATVAPGMPQQTLELVADVFAAVAKQTASSAFRGQVQFWEVLAALLLYFSTPQLQALLGNQSELVARSKALQELRLGLARFANALQAFPAHKLPASSAPHAALLRLRGFGPLEAAPAWSALWQAAPQQAGPDLRALLLSLLETLLFRVAGRFSARAAAPVVIDAAEDAELQRYLQQRKHSMQPRASRPSKANKANKGADKSASTLEGGEGKDTLEGGEVKEEDTNAGAEEKEEKDASAGEEEEEESKAADASAGEAEDSAQVGLQVQLSAGQEGEDGFVEEHWPLVDMGSGDDAGWAEHVDQTRQGVLNRVDVEAWRFERERRRQQVLAAAVTAQEQAPRDLPPAPPRPKPLVILDAPNIAMRHGNHKVFSTAGVQLAIEWYQRMGHPVLAFTPAFHLDYDYVSRRKREENIGMSVRATKMPDNISLLLSLRDEGLLVATPAQDYDDSYCIEYAMRHGGYIVSNDRYRDHVEGVEPSRRAAVRAWLKTHLITFAFVKDEFLPNPDFKFSGDSS